MSVLETMALGIPNICTKIAAIPDVIENNKQGYLINSGDVKALEDKLVDICTDNEKRMKMSMQSYLQIKNHFSINVCGNTVKQLYREVIEENARRN